LAARELEQIFLLSPANLGGERAALLLSDRARFPLARALHLPGGAPLGEVFSFLSGLYFRGKLTYARAFGTPPAGLPGALVITPGEGLRDPAESVTAARLKSWAQVRIDLTDARYLAPLTMHARALARGTRATCRIVLLGSIATDKYTRPLLDAFGPRLLFPPDFVGRGDMSRGALMLQAARLGRELAYEPVSGAARHGPRAPSVRARPRTRA
jgi:hypothetical protein